MELYNTCGTIHMMHKNSSGFETFNFGFTDWLMSPDI